MTRPYKQTSWAQGIYEQSAVPLERVGALRVLEDGRKFRYSCSGAAITPGKAVEGSAITEANLTAQAMPDVAIAAQSFVYTAGGNVTYVANYFEGGYVLTTEGTGLGQLYSVAGNTAVAASTTITVTLDDPVAVAFDSANTKGSLMANEYRYVITAATITNPVLGVQLINAAAANAYGWVQTGGPACVLITGTPAIGSYLIANATDGSLGISSMAASSFHVGYVATVAGATGKYYPVVLTID